MSVSSKKINKEINNLSNHLEKKCEISKKEYDRKNANSSSDESDSD